MPSSSSPPPMPSSSSPPPMPPSSSPPSSPPSSPATDWVFEDAAPLLFRVRRTLSQMLRDRGYDVSPSDLTMTLPEFLVRFTGITGREDLDMKTSKTADPSDKILVFFPKDPKAVVSVLKSCVAKTSKEGANTAIVVSESVTPAARSYIAENSNRKLKLESFLESELMVNITEHHLVPRHIPQTDEEKKELLERYAIKETQLPRIMFSDPVARYYGLRRGQVVKIIRKSPNAGEYITYRFVV